MSDQIQRIADEWRDRARDLAQWTMDHLVNRTDVWGRYLPKKYRKDQDGQTNNAITAPFRDERGKVWLNISSLEKHYRARTGGGVLGLHSVSPQGTSRWLAIDIDLHDDENLSVTPEGNYVAAQGWFSKLQQSGLDPLLLDSNGRGGFHLLVVFAEAMDTGSVHSFLKQFVSDYEKRGLDVQPELFPSNRYAQHYGKWLRLPGRHHTHPHYTKVWNDEPWAEDQWLEGLDAIDRILRTRLASTDLLNKLGIQKTRKTICLDFDGVMHSYHSGWKGETVIPDDPVHGTRQAVARLRENYRVVVHSSRCRSEEGCQAIQQWLARHEIEVDEVCMHKPPAIAYMDDRAIAFHGDWEQTIAEIRAFRR